MLKVQAVIPYFVKYCAYGIKSAILVLIPVLRLLLLAGQEMIKFVKEFGHKYTYFLYRAIMILLAFLQSAPEFCNAMICHSCQPKRIPDGHSKSAVNASFFHLYCLIS